MADSARKTEVSVVIPVCNEAGTVKELHARLTKVLSDAVKSFEIIFVDDGSNDGTLEALKVLRPVTIVRLSHNSGKTTATAAGVRESKGEIIVTMDGDLENLPEDIPLLLEKMNEGFDVVSGWRKDRWQGEMITRKIPSVLANWFISKVTGVHLHDHGGFFKAYARESVVSLPFSGDIHRLMPAYAASAGAGVAEVPVAWQRRRYGVSKYGLMRTFRVILDVIVFYFFGKYGARPMHFFGVAGFISAFLGFLTFIWMLLLKLLEGLRFTQSPLPVLTTFFFMIAVQFVLMGLLAEMLHRVFKTSEAGAALPIKETLRF